MEKRCILHCDLNNFFASVECVEHPEWKKKPMAVCGSSEERHGIVLAKNDLAKKFNIKTGDVIWQAKQKCNELIIAEPHYSKYLEYSKEVKKVYGEYTNQVESFGLDECWLDVGGSKLLFGDGKEIADKLRNRIRQEIGLTISVGVSFNKIFAKLGSDMKKPDATTVIPYESFKDIIWDLDVGDLLFAGRATVRKLNSVGIYTIGNLANSPYKMINNLLGKNGCTLWAYANGLDNSPVKEEGYTIEQKSIGRSTTGKKDLCTMSEIKHVLLALSEDVSRRLREQQLMAGLITIWMRDCNLFSQTHQTALTTPTRLSEILCKEALNLIQQNWSKIPLRSVGISAGMLQKDNDVIQYSFWNDIEKLERIEKKEAGVDKLRQRFGKDIIVRASQMRKIYDLNNGGEHCSFSYISR